MAGLIGARPVEGKPLLTDVDLEHVPAAWALDRLDVRVGDEQRSPHERESPWRVEERAGDAPDLISGRVQDGDLVRTDQAHVQVAGLGECDACGLRPRP